MCRNAEELYDEALRETLGDSPDLDRVVAKLKKAIDGGSGRATYALATWYLHGKEPYVERDYEEAARLLTSAAKLGLSDAMFDLAVSYEQGKGVLKNESEAFEYYLKAAIRGDGAAIFNIGRCLFWGIGTEQDRNEAQIWLERAKELGTYEKDEVA